MPIADDRRHLGDFGESAAAAYLIQQGYHILQRKWRCPRGEIDLVARQGDQVVFVEVRTRRTTFYGVAEESITTTKQLRLIDLAYCYLDLHDLLDTTLWRIDVIAVVVGRQGQIIHLNHITSAVEQNI